MFRKIIKGLKDVWCGTLEFDTEPKKDSFNPVTSGGVYDAINGAGGAKEIVYFDVDPSNPPSGIYDDIAEVLSNGKLPAIRSDGKLYMYSSTGTDRYVFVGVFSTDGVGYEEFSVYTDDNVQADKHNASLGYAALPSSGTEEHPAWAKVCELEPKPQQTYTTYGLALLFTAENPSNNGKNTESGILAIDVGSNWFSNSNCCNASWMTYTPGSEYAKILGVKIIGKYGLPSNPALAPYPIYKIEVWVKYYGGHDILVNALQNAMYFTGMVQGDFFKFPEGHIAVPQSTEPSYSDTEEYVYKNFFYAAESPSVTYTHAQSLTSGQKAQGRDNIGAASASDVTALQSQVSSLSDVSAYSVKGEATVAQLNAGPSGIQAGWAYQLTDSGTLTNGTLAVVAGDTVAWDGTKWFPLVRSDYYATKTYAQNVAHNIAPEFDPTRTSVNPYKAWKDTTVYEGKTYLFTTNHYGEWDASHVVLFDKLLDKFRKLDNDVGVYDIGTTYNTLDPEYSRVMAVFPIKDVDSTFVWKISNKSTNGNVNIRVTSAATPYAGDILETAATVGSSDTSGEGSFTISAVNKSSAKYIVVLNATANLLVSFNLELWTKLSVDGELKETKSLIDFLNDATMLLQSRFVQGGINGTTGEDAASNGTVRPDKHIDVDDLVSVSLGSTSGLHVQLYSYNSSGSYLGRNDLGASAFNYNSKQIKAYRNAKFVTFGIYLDGGGNFSPSDLATNGKFSIKLTTISTIPKMNKNTNTDFSLMLKSVGSTPMATWIDDDGVVTHTNGGISGVVVPVAEAVGIPVTFAVIPPLSDSVVVGGVTMTRGEYFNILQKKGHQIVSHPEHTYWYGANYNLDKVKETLIESLQDLQEYKMLHSDMMVYPGSSGTNSEVVEQVRKWCVCGVLSGYGTPNHLGDSTKWAIKRTFVNFADYDSIHSSDPGYVSAMAWYKSQVDAAFANGDWIIFGTHSYQFTTSEDTTDPNANTLGNLKELMQYAVTKGLEFRTLWDAYNRRKCLFEFNEINQ